MCIFEGTKVRQNAQLYKTMYIFLLPLQCFSLSQYNVMEKVYAIMPTEKLGKNISS